MTKETYNHLAQCKVECSTRVEKGKKTVPLIQEYMGLQDFCIKTIKHFAMGFE